MFCPNCGDQTTQGLKYCKRCGAGLGALTNPTEQKASIGKAIGGSLFLVALVSIVGFIALFVTVDSLGEHGFDRNALVGLMAFGGATVMGVVGLLVWLLLRLTGAAASTSKTQTPVIREHTPQQLPAQPIGIPSVTENTTRNFDPRYRDKSELE